MTDRYLKHKPSGQMYIYQSAFATHPDFVEVADLEGNPLPDAIDGDFAVVDEPAKPVKQPAKKPKAKAKAPVGLVEPSEDEDEDEDLSDFDVALSADASRGL